MERQVRTMWSRDVTVQAGVDIVRQKRDASGEVVDRRIGKEGLEVSRGRRKLAKPFIESFESLEVESDG